MCRPLWRKKGPAAACSWATFATALPKIALVVYRMADVAFLRRGWINLDLVWTTALLLCGFALLAA